MTKFISLKTSLPDPKSREIAQRREKYVTKPMGGSLSPCYIAHGEGPWSFMYIEINSAALF